jgi:phage/plasmid-associated DNA primase
VILEGLAGSGVSANRFTARHRDDLRFVNTWGRWLVWDGKRWQPDETLMVTDHARGLVRDASSEILSQKLATVVGRYGQRGASASSWLDREPHKVGKADGLCTSRCESGNEKFSKKRQAES